MTDEGPQFKEPMRDPVQGNETFVDYETYMEPFLGWRAWNVVEEDSKELRLRSITYQRIWMPEVAFEAICAPTLWSKNRPKHKGISPNKDCGCGIHAVMSKNDSLVWQNFGDQSKLRVVGEVKLWGVVYKYTRGYLAQYAYPKSILVPHEIPDAFSMTAQEAVKELRRTYRGVEVKLF